MEECMVKYQIFVSSTFIDLEGERDQVIKAVLEMGHIPVGMEMFSAADEEQWKIIARQIDESDYYVVIVGHRYGSMDGGVGFTEKEFDYAVSKGVPILGFIVDESVDPLAKNVESDSFKIAALAAFKVKVKGRPVGFWKSSEDLHGKVSIALMKAFNTSPRPGWTRVTSIAGPEVMQELSRLSKENADLRESLDRVSRQEERDHVAYLKDKLETLRAIDVTLGLRKAGESKWSVKVEVTLFDLFHQLAPEMMVEMSVEKAADYVALLNNPDGEALSARAPFAFNSMRVIFADFSALGLIEPSKRKHPVADKDVYWALTEEGMELLSLHRADNLIAVASKVRGSAPKTTLARKGVALKKANGLKK
jgi:hypothetical protein